MGVSNGYDIGVNGRDLILKTSGKIFVKVADKFYELDFKNEHKKEVKRPSEVKESDIVFLDALSKTTYPGDNKLVINNNTLYVTKGGNFKKIVNSEEEVHLTTSSSELVDVKPDNLFTKISDNTWGLGKSLTGYNMRLIQEDFVEWNDYTFYNSVKRYFFEDVYGNLGKNADEFWENIFFNKTGENKKEWSAKSKSEIESIVLTDVYKNNKPVGIKDFSSLYNSFWRTQKEFDIEMSEYLGKYAVIEFEEWSYVFSPKHNITINECPAIVVGVVDDSAIVKFKGDAITLLPENIRQSKDTLVFYEKDDVAFLDVLDDNSKMQTKASQNENDVRIRIGNLNTLLGYSGIGAVFNKNVAIKNPPFVLNIDGSGNIGDSFYWDKDGELSGTFFKYIDDLSEKVEALRSSYTIHLNQYNELLEKVSLLETLNSDLKQQYDLLLERIKKLEDKS